MNKRRGLTTIAGALLGVGVLVGSGATHADARENSTHWTPPANQSVWHPPAAQSPGYGMNQGYPGTARYPSQYPNQSPGQYPGQYPNQYPAPYPAYPASPSYPAGNGSHPAPVNGQPSWNTPNPR